MTANGSIIFPDSEWRKINDYTELCPVEIACMGYAKLEGSNVLVQEVFLIPQDISLSSVDFLEKGFPYAIAKAAEEGRVDELKFCWHSHATHPACFSTTDEDWIEKIRDTGPIDWFASAVLNKRGDTYGQLDYFGIEGPLAEFASHVTVKLDVGSESTVPNEERAAREAEIEEFCTRKPTATASSTKKGSKKSGKGPAGSDSSRKRGATDETSDIIAEQASIEAWNQMITARDTNLHKVAKEERWECYIIEDVAHYWDSMTKTYQGEAPIPLDVADGTFAIDIEPTVIDGDAEEIEDEEYVPLDAAEDRLLQEAMDRGLL